MASQITRIGPGGVRRPNMVPKNHLLTWESRGPDGEIGMKPVNSPMNSLRNSTKKPQFRGSIGSLLNLRGGGRYRT